MQCLYQQDMLGIPAADPGEEFWSRQPLDSSTREFAQLLLRVYRESPNRIDSLISDHLENWNLQRMAFVDRSILRIAVSELLARQTPSPVVINEALEIAKKFGDIDSREFINGVLDAIRKYLEEEDHLEKA